MKMMCCILMSMDLLSGIEERFKRLRGVLDERSRRLLLAAESQALGRAGISAVAKITGVSRQVIRQGIAELTQAAVLPERRIRRAGGGRKKAVVRDPSLKADLEEMLGVTTHGDPHSPLRWTCRSVRNLEAELNTMGHSVSHQVVADLLHELEYSLQANRKTSDGASHADWNAQFAFLNGRVKRYLAKNEPVISVDTNSKGVVGDLENGGEEPSPAGDPEKKPFQNFPIPELARDNSQGTDDMGRTAGWMSVGVSHDNAEFTVESIRRWWRSMGQQAYPKANSLLIAADDGGGNGSRVRLWQLRLQQFADETAHSIAVCHFPPGTSKWTGVEHRLSSSTTQNWRGQPPVSLEVIVSLIAGTLGRAGRFAPSEPDTHAYPRDLEVSDQEFAKLNLRKNRFLGDWNYEIHPRSS